jgi:hypothetical protein
MSKMWRDIARSYRLDGYAVKIKAVQAEAVQAEASAELSQFQPVQASSSQCWEVVLRRRLRLPFGLGIPLEEVERFHAATEGRAMSMAVSSALYWHGRDMLDPANSTRGAITFVLGVGVWAVVVGAFLLVLG